MKFLVTYILMEREIPTFESSLNISIKNLISYCNHDITHLFVIQGNDGCIPSAWLLLPQVEVKYIPESGLSVARNIGLDMAEKKRFDFILFHESSIVLTQGFCQLMSFATDSPLCGQLEWSMDNYYSTKELKVEKVKPRIIKDSYVGLYLFPVKLIKGLRFNPRVGLGKNTVLKAGEDSAFLAAFLRLNNISLIDCAKSALVIHPPRNNDRSKQLFYSRAQGALFRYFFNRRLFNYGVVGSFFLFMGNTIFGLMILRTKSLNVFLERLKGFFSEDYLFFEEDSKK